MFNYYKDFTLKKIGTEKFSHIFFLLYWPVYILFFFLAERLITVDYNVIYCAIDDLIPFCEFFVVPYFLWYAFLMWIVIYSFFFDIPAFKKFSQFAIITYTVACIIYAVYPSCQNLRPQEFARDNIFTQITSILYIIDTNTNVLPSVHVIGSFAVLFTAWHSKRYSTVLWRTVFLIITLIISASTVFMKQHSFIDVIAGAVISFAVYPIVFLRKKKTKPD